MSQVRQNFHKDCEDTINKQINVELSASYVYMTMAYHFHRDDVALMGFHKYFKECSEEEREHAYRLMEYMNKRGGKIILSEIKAPEKQEWTSPVEAMVDALNLEKGVNESLLHLHNVGSGHMDINLCDFLEQHYLQEQVDAIKEIGDHITNLKRVGEGLGVYMFDQRLDKEAASN
ncbi:soma ferritin isoform X2 [Diabrotica virgifera virgifera]|uniref:Ferritin n=1 Tax=Diabrotica virgifera virgifera TaxID=50390 RepID=A0A6P7FP91_DIAVI|nr:soma ferritin isoform X2 [Diabrotica virgifera virgifera]